MALNLNKLFVRVSGQVPVSTITTASLQEGNVKKIYFLEQLHQIVNNGVVYGVDPSTVQDITDLQQLIGQSKLGQGENTVIERLQALEAIKIATADSSYASITHNGSIPVIDLNMVGIGTGNHGLVDAADAKGYIDEAVAAATTDVSAGAGITVDSTTGSNQQKVYTVNSSLSLAYNNSDKTITLTGANNGDFGTIDVSAIIGNGVLEDTSYNPNTGMLTLTFATTDGTGRNIDVNLQEMLDIGDIMVDPDSSNYLSITTASESTDSNQATFKTLIHDVSTATNNATGLVDAYDVKQYIQAQTTDLHVDVDSKNAYIDASVDSVNNKQVNIEANVQDLTANAGTRGTYSVAADGTVSLSGETAPTLTGVADSLTDGDDVATKVKTYVDAKVAAEAARTDANIEGAVKALDAEVTSSDGTNVTVKVTEVDGKITAVNVTDSYATIDSSLGVTNNTRLVTGADIEKVKTYVDAVTAADGISAEGDNKYIDASVDSNNNKKINVAANVANMQYTPSSGDTAATLSGTQNTLVDGAQAAGQIQGFVNDRITFEIDKLDSTTSATNTYVTTSVTEVDGKLTDSSVALTFGTMNGTTANSATNGIAKAEDVQDFVDTYDFWETYSA